MTESESYHIDFNDLKRFTENVFKAMACSESDAAQAADVLIQADLRGIDSHGVARLSGYIRLFEKQRINPKPQFKIVRDKKSVFTLDGDAGLGLLTAPKAMEIALERTAIYGSGFGSICNSNHFGIGAYHAMKALSHDCIGLSMTNASPLVAPLNSKERLLGTNPICFAIPAGDELPFILDMATSAAANGKLEIAARKNKPVPTGWLATQEGKDSNNPNGLKEGGFLLPLGSDADHGAHKGYGLGALVDILCGVLSGANYGPWVPPFVAFLPLLSDLPGKGIGHFVGAMDIDGFIDKDLFKKRMDHWIQRFKKADSIDLNLPVIIPGAPEFETYATRQQSGIPLNLKVREDLVQLAEQYHLEHPF